MESLFALTVGVCCIFVSILMLKADVGKLAGFAKEVLERTVLGAGPSPDTIRAVDAMNEDLQRRVERMAESIRASEEDKADLVGRYNALAHERNGMRAEIATHKLTIADLTRRLEARDRGAGAQRSTSPPPSSADFRPSTEGGTT